MAYLTTLALFALAVLTIYGAYTKTRRYLTIRAFKTHHKCQPPRPLPGSGLIGYRVIKELWTSHRAANSLEKHTAHHRSLGDTWELSFFHVDLIMTISPENIKALLSTQFADFGLSHRLPVFAPLLTGGIFVSDGPAWQHSRALIRPAFTRDRVADLPRLDRHVQRLISQIPVDGTTTVDLMPLFFRLTLDYVTEFLLGESMESLVSGPDSEQQRFEAAFDYVQRQLGGWNTSGWGAWVWPNRRCEEGVRVVHRVVDGYVEKARTKARAARGREAGKEKDAETEAASGGDAKQGKKGAEEKSGRYIFLDELALSTDDPVEMRNEILNIIIAGRDTTASMLTSTFHALARRPDIWARLRAEIAPLEGQPPDYETLRNLKYLRYVMNEMIRLYPPVPANSRQAIRDTTLPHGGGLDGTFPIFVAKGQVVGYSPWSMHRLHATFQPDGEALRPERWADGEGEGEKGIRAGWEFLAFNGGPRICPGQQFALTTLGFAIVRLVQRFARLESRDPEPWTEDISLTAGSKNGAKVVFRV
ncbi:MAG: cytochrome P450 alkane hydroxylase [Lasallia pustulata]|uniref:Cytochrome P450 alkane hydroxylase n=1 Tax=Lasallia pustulata TaxID=136370 RepID=A0A5M8PNX5_9LECA|nr:MAG: cytochrome P450 alkane hydroxylase [Lasallia pustulata]